VLAFFVVLPIQFWLVATAHFDLFTVFIPVYVFLAIPVVSALADDPARFWSAMPSCSGASWCASMA
jgi:phosphatidate cytidylyltransferase